MRGARRRNARRAFGKLRINRAASKRKPQMSMHRPPFEQRSDRTAFVGHGARAGIARAETTGHEVSSPQLKHWHSFLEDRYPGRSIPREELLTAEEIEWRHKYYDTHTLRNELTNALATLSGDDPLARHIAEILSRKGEPNEETRWKGDAINALVIYNISQR